MRLVAGLAPPAVTDDGAATPYVVTMTNARRRPEDTLVDPSIRTWRPTRPRTQTSPALDWHSGTWRSEAGDGGDLNPSMDVTSPIPTIG